MHIVDNFGKKTTFLGGGDGEQDAATCLKKTSNSSIQIAINF